MGKRRLMVLFTVSVFAGLLLAACGGVANNWVGGEDTEIVQAGPFSFLTTDTNLFELPLQVEQTNRADWLLVKAPIESEIAAETQGVWQGEYNCPLGGHY